MVRPCWPVDDIDAAAAASVQAGGQVARPPMAIPGHGTFAIYHQGGNDHGFWQLPRTACPAAPTLQFV